MHEYPLQLLKHVTDMIEGMNDHWSKAIWLIYAPLGSVYFVRSVYVGSFPSAILAVAFIAFGYRMSRLSVR